MDAVSIPVVRMQRINVRNVCHSLKNMHRDTGLHVTYWDKAEEVLFIYIMIPGSKGLNPHELAHRWVKDLGTRPDMSIKVGL